MIRVLLASLLVSLAFGCAAPEDTASTEPSDAPSADAEQQIVTVYSSRHYDADEQIYDAFEADTGIAVEVVDGDSAGLLERLRREGEQSSADLFVAVDAGRLHQAEQDGIFQPIESAVLNERVPENLRHPDGLWFGLSKRARVIIRAVDRVAEGEIARYEDLADPKWQGKVLIRSSANVYNQSLVGSILEAVGPEATEAWCQGLVANLARDPQGGDRDQIRAVAAGEGDLAVVNTYYLAKMIASADKPEDQEAASKVAVVFPNQGEGDRGTHVNISGAGVVVGAPNRDNAIRLLEYLTEAKAQGVIAGENKEYPVVPGYEPVAELQGFGAFEEDTLNATVFGGKSQEVVQIMDRCGWR